MNLSKEKMWRLAERALKRTNGYQQNRELGKEKNYGLMYVLAKGKYPHAKDVIAVAGCEDVAIQFNPITDSGEIDLWGFNFERDLFENLQAGYEIAGMTLDCHAGVWYTIEDWHDGGIEHEKGMQKYLGYCKRNGITKERLEKKVGYLGMDVMGIYNPKSERTMSHKDLER